PPPEILTFSDVPSDLSQLDPLEPHHRHLDSSPDSNHSVVLPPVRPTSGHKSRRPSPGLAARLKALGFGGTTRQSSAPTIYTNDRIGRLPEDQLRSIDEKHQANSLQETVERRGRAWKGAGAPLQLLRSRSSRSSLRSRGRVEDDILEVEENTAYSGSPSSLRKPGPELHLPEIPPVPPLEMDTNKYRLPDHTNGNGTKALSDTRREHIERDTRSLSLSLQDQENLTPPPPLPKDTPPGGTASNEFNPDAESYFNPLGLQRPGSIYTISRLSFANQLAQLTALQLPDAGTLSGKISAIPTAQSAAKALINAAEQIRMWIYKATEVIGGLDSDGDIEWAAAGGREGYEEVENLVARFEQLINVYVGAIEELQGRNDIASVTSDDLQRAVTQMESILAEWAKIRQALKVAKAQIEIAMEWEELWNSVLGEVQNEMDDLCRLVFEMEERRHKSLMAVANGDGVDIGDLETIVEETPPIDARNNRMSMPAFPLSPVSPAGAGPVLTHDDSSLLALFARMQPLKASLDFLPMRLSMFEARAEPVFPSACEELVDRRTSLEESYKKLEKDAESLRKELGEDKWVLVFRGAGRQAQKMTESVERSVSKLREAVDSGMHLTNPAALIKKIESYEAKKTHYGPAIERVLSIIDKGVKDRLTVNGEILRLHTETQSNWDHVKRQMRDLDLALEEVQADKRGQTLRDSISSMLSNDRSTVASGHETPGSSPPSSVIMSSLGLDPVTPLAKKPRSASGGSHLPQPSSSRRTLAPPGSQIARKPLGPRVSTLSSPSNASTLARNTITPVGNHIPRSTSSLADNRPRWNHSVNTVHSDTGHNFKPLSLTTPSPYAKRSPTPSSLTPNSQASKLPVLRSPLSRAGTTSPMPEETPSRLSASRLSFRDRVSSPVPYAQHALAKPKLASQASMSALNINSRRTSLQPPRSQAQDPARRPASSMTTSRRTSMLPQPKGKADTVTGRHSPQALAGARTAMRTMSRGSSDDNKPRWR
ncbi:cortical protein KAR9-domain-containing protein, partial [Truncatella angustata]